MEQSFSAPSANPETEEDRGQVAPESKWHRRAANRPEELFQAALAVVLEKGYRATRLEDIAHHAGVTKPLIYHYFKDKDDLVFKSLEWKIGQILDDMRSESGPSEAGTNERLRKLFEYSWARWRRTEF